jgi:hypothetical protein
VRDAAAGGSLEAAVYDARRRTLGKWRPAGDVAQVVADLPHPEVKLAVPASVVDTEPFPVEPKREEDKAPWYRTPWGTGAIIGGTVLLTAAAILLATPEPDVMRDYHWVKPVW